MNEEKNSPKQIEIFFSAHGAHKCPYCQKDIEKEAVTCPYCHGSFVSTNRVRNIIGMIIMFALLYWLISSFVSCEADREMEKIEKQLETQMRGLR
jgi:predicted nucleic acid-binding Zn ribbon protein